MDDNNEKQTSKFSSGINQLMRLDQLWKDSNSYSVAGLYSKRNTKLDVIWRELARDLSDKVYGERKALFDAFDTNLGKAGPFMDNGSDTFNDPSRENMKTRSKQYSILNEKELFLRRLENFLGKGTTWDDEDDDGFD